MSTPNVTSQVPQSSFNLLLQNAATGNVNGVVANPDACKTAYLEVLEANVGTATLTVTGSVDGTNFFPIFVANTNAATRTFAATFAVTQNGRFWLLLQDTAPYIRAALSSNTGNVTVKLFAIPI